MKIFTVFQEVMNYIGKVVKKYTILHMYLSFKLDSLKTEISNKMKQIQQF